MTEGAPAIVVSGRDLQRLANGLLNTLLCLGKTQNSALSATGEETSPSSSSIQVVPPSPPLPPTTAALSQTLDEIVRTIRLLDEREGVSSTSRWKPIQRVKSGDPPPPPPETIMSIMQLRAIYTAIECIWVGGIRSFVKSRASGFDDGNNTPPSMLFKREIVDDLYSHLETDDIFGHISTILETCRVNFFMKMMLERNISRILITLILLKENQRSKNLIRELLDSSMYKYQVVCALRSLLGSSLEVTTVSSRCLTQIMLSDGGLNAIMLSFLDGIDDGGEKADAAQGKLVRLITSVPKAMAKEEFFRILSPQLHQVYSSSLYSGDFMASRVTGLIISKICQLSLHIGIEILNYIAQPILAIHEKVPTESNPLVSEEKINIAVTILHHMFTSIPIDPVLLYCTMVSKIGRTMLSLNVFIVSEYKLCVLAKQVEEFCFKYLALLDPVAATFEVLPILFNVSLPFRVSFDKPIETEREASMWNLKNQFISGPNGGIEITSMVSDDDRGRFKSINLGELLQEFSSLEGKLTPELISINSRSKYVIDIIRKFDEHSTPSNTGQDRCLASHVFIVLLEEYLGTDDDLSAFRQCPINFLSQRRALCGLILLSLQSCLSIDMLLRDGHRILMLLKAFIDNRARFLIKRNEEGPTYMDKFDDDSLPKQPLVVEVGTVRREIPIIESTSSEDSEGDTDIIGTVLAILSAILSFGSPSRPVEEEKLLRGLLTSLQSLSSLESDPEISQSASDVALVLLTRSASGVINDPSGVRQSKVLSSGNSAFEKVVNDSTDLLKSESPAMRGLGTRNIIIALREPVEPLSDDDRAIGVRVLTSLLADPESFVYLNVVHAISRLAFSDKGQVFTILLDMYAPPVLSASVLTVRQRVILSEAIALILRRSGDMAPVYAPACLRACILCIKNDEIDPYSATGKEEINLLRQSAISLLAEAFLFSNWSAMKYLNDVLDISLGIIQLENPAISSKKYSENLLSGLKYGVQTSRRAAAFLIRYILTGLHQKLFRTTDGRSYEAIISALERVEAYPSRTVLVEGKLINVSEDSVVLFHVRCALSLIEDLQARELLMTTAS